MNISCSLWNRKICESLRRRKCAGWCRSVIEKNNKELLQCLSKKDILILIIEMIEKASVSIPSQKEAEEWDVF